MFEFEECNLTPKDEVCRSCGRQYRTPNRCRTCKQIYRTPEREYRIINNAKKAFLVSLLLEVDNKFIEIYSKKYCCAATKLDTLDTYLCKKLTN